MQVQAVWNRVRPRSPAGETQLNERMKGSGAPDGIRTHGPQIRNLVLYPAELRMQCYFA
jgi:hypothetical protein